MIAGSVALDIATRVDDQRVGAHITRNLTRELQKSRGFDIALDQRSDCTIDL